MLDQARASMAQSRTTETKFQFMQGSAEELSQTGLEAESVDLIIAGNKPFLSFFLPEMNFYFI